MKMDKQRFIRDYEIKTGGGNGLECFCKGKNSLLKINIVNAFNLF